MPDALKTDATKVRGCSSSTWVYPTRLPDGRLHFLADSNAAITKGVVALILSAVQDRQPTEVAATDIWALLEPFNLTRELSSNRTQGVPNMIALVRDTAARLAAALARFPSSTPRNAAGGSIPSASSSLRARSVTAEH
jgi:cysteine desulfuration protein SufE